MTSILLFGATGYLGGNTLYHLLKRTQSEQQPVYVVAPASSKSGAEKVAAWARKVDSELDVKVISAHKPALEPRSRGLDIVIISRDRAETWYEGAEHLATSTDCAVQLATSDDLELTKAINRGLATARSNGRRGTLVHASGTQLIESEPVGKFIDTVPVYDDTDLSQLRSIPDEAAHRLIDLEIINDIASGKIGGGAVVCPATIWGIANGPNRRISQQIPGMVEKALSPLNRQAVYCGEGTNVWNAVHVEELSDLTVSLIKRWAFEDLPASAPEAHSTFYFAGTKELFSFGEVAVSIGEVLASTKNPATKEPLLPTAEAKSVPVPRFDKSQKGVRIEDGDRAANADEDEKRAPSWPCRTNSRCVSKRAEQEFGWVAQRKFDRDAQRSEIKAYVDIWSEDGTLDEKLQA